MSTPSCDSQSYELFALSAPLYLYACDYLSQKEKIIMQHIMSLTNKFYDNGGCNLSNKELAESHEVCEQTVSNTIAKAKTLGWIVSNYTDRHKVNETWVNKRHLKIVPPIEWKFLGVIYQYAFFVKSEYKEWAQDIIAKIRKYAKNNNNFIARKAINFFIGKDSQTIKKFIDLIYVKYKKYKKRSSIELIAFLEKRVGSIAKKKQCFCAPKERDNNRNKQNVAAE